MVSIIIIVSRISNKSMRNNTLSTKRCLCLLEVVHTYTNLKLIISVIHSNLFDAYWFYFFFSFSHKALKCSIFHWCHVEMLPFYLCYWLLIVVNTYYPRSKPILNRNKVWFLQWKIIIICFWIIIIIMWGVWMSAVSSTETIFCWISFAVNVEVQVEDKN